MLKIQHVFQIKFFLCVPTTQITSIRSCVNRYSYWNKSCDPRFTQLSIKMEQILKSTQNKIVETPEA